MIFWIRLWQFCLIGSLLAFALMSIIVTIGGAYDIRRLIFGLEKDKTDDSSSSRTRSPLEQDNHEPT